MLRNPVLYWLEVLLDFPCLEKGSFDIATTEVDPLWNDDELTLILNPDAVLFANPTRRRHVPRTVWPRRWASDAAALLVRRLPGGVYPLNGHVAVHLRRAGVDADRAAAHRQDASLIAWGYHAARRYAART